MTRAVVCVATTPHYQKGLRRLLHHASLQRQSVAFWDSEGEWPLHAEKPYAFKAYALKVMHDRSDLLLWCDASILPIRSLEPLWERIEKEGYWIARNGWNNRDWTADSAYGDLFAPEIEVWAKAGEVKTLGYWREINREIPHVVATSFGLNVKHPIGKAFLDEYYRLASETKAFCGPWTNAYSGLGTSWDGVRVAPCGPADVLGHRHDQTAASVIAWRLGMKLTDCPEVFAYSKRRPDGTLHLEDQDGRTILLADGKMDDGVVL